MRGKPVRRGRGPQRRPAWSWVQETCPASGLARPSEARGRRWGQPHHRRHGVTFSRGTATSVSGKESSPPGTLLPPPAPPNPRALGQGQPSSRFTTGFIASLKTGLALVCMWTDNGLQWVPWHSWGFCFVWVAFTVVPEAGARERSQARFLFSLHWDFIQLSTEAFGLVHTVDCKDNTLNCLIDSSYWIKGLEVKVIWTSIFQPWLHIWIPGNLVKMWTLVLQLWGGP